MMTTWCPEGIPKENLSEATKTPSSEDLPQLVADATINATAAATITAANATAAATVTAANAAAATATADAAAAIAAAAADTAAAELTLRACVAACMEAAATQVARAGAAAEEATNLLRQGYAGFKVWYRGEWRREEEAGSGLSPNKNVCLGITAANMERGERREVVRPTALDGGRGSKGKAGFLEKGSNILKGSSEAGRESKRIRSHEVNTSMKRIAARRDAQLQQLELDVHTQWRHHITANTSLYNQLGKSFEVVMDVEATVSMCNESSGLLGACYRRHLKQQGVKVASKAAVCRSPQEVPPPISVR